MSAKQRGSKSFGIVFQWVLMNALGISLGITARQFVFQIISLPGSGGIRLLIEGIAMGVIMGGIQQYSLNQFLQRKRDWFLFSVLGWAVGWSGGWSLAWRLLGGQGLDIVFAGRGVFIGLAVGLLQYWVLRRQATGAGWWIPANIGGWAIGLAVATLIGGPFAWMLAGAVAGIMTAIPLAWLLQHPVNIGQRANLVGR